MSKKGGLHKKHIEQAIEYLFKSKPVDKKESKPYIRNKLNVRKIKGLFSFEISDGIITGLKGFQNLIRSHTILNEGETVEERFTEVYYQGYLLSKKDRLEFFKEIKKL